MVNIIGRRVGIQETGPVQAESNLGKVFAAMGTKLFGDTLTPEYKRQMTQKVSDENEMRKAYVDSTGADGINSTPRIASLAAALGTIDPNALGRMRALEGARTGGVDSPVAAAALTGLGQFSSTPEHQRRALGNNLMLKDREEQTKLTLAGNLPETVMVNGVPTVVPRSEAYGAPAVVSSDQNKALRQNELWPTIPQERQQDFAFGAQSPGELGVASVGGKTVPAFARPGGFYSVQGNQPIEGTVDGFGKVTATNSDAIKPASGDQSALLNRRVAARTATSAIDNLDKALASPNAGAAVGVIGKSATLFNDIRAQTEAAAKLLNPNSGFAADVNAPGVSAAVDGAMTRLFNDQGFNAKAQSLGIEAVVLRSQIVDLAYTIAKAKDPGGRMSNQDVDRAAEILGGALMDPVAGRQVLSGVRQQILESQNIFEQEFERMYPGKGGQPNGAAPPAGAPQQAAQPSQPRQAQDGNFYVPDPQRPGKYLMVKP